MDEVGDGDGDGDGDDGWSFGVMVDTEADEEMGSLSTTGNLVALYSEGNDCNVVWSVLSSFAIIVRIDGASCVLCFVCLFVCLFVCCF